MCLQFNLRAVLVTGKKMYQWNINNLDQVLLEGDHL